MISYLMQKKWKYLSSIAAHIPDKPLKLAAKGFIGLQKRELMGNVMPKRIVFFVTKKCNLNCRHCFYIPHQSSAIEMSLSQIQQLACSTKNNLRQMIFTGGEPFLRDDFYDIVFSFAENGCQIMNINTNGIFTEKIRLFLEKVLKETSVIFMMSLDGPPAIHDDIRNMPGASKKTSQTIALLSDCYQKYPSRFGSVAVSTSINRLNFAHLPEVIDWVRSFKNVSHIFNFTRSANLHTIGVSASSLSGFDVNKDIILNTNEMKKVLRCLEKEVWETQNNSLPVLGSRRIMIEAVRLLEKGTTPLTCWAGKTEIIIYPDGDVGICEMLKSVGNLKETGYNLIKFYQQHREKFQAVKKCRCTHDCNLTSSVRFSPESLVEVVKKRPKIY